MTTNAVAAIIAIGAAGLIMALSVGVWGLAPRRGAEMPAWATLAGVGSGMLLVGLAAGLIASEFRNKGSRPSPETAQVNFHVYGDERIPKRMSSSNVWRWVFLKAVPAGSDKKSNERGQNTIVTLFIAFDTPVATGAVEASSPDIRLPPHEVVEFNARFAIVVFRGDIPAGRLEIKTHSTTRPTPGPGQVSIDAAPRQGRLTFHDSQD